MHKHISYISMRLSTSLCPGYFLCFLFVSCLAQLQFRKVLLGSLSNRFAVLVFGACLIILYKSWAISRDSKTGYSSLNTFLDALCFLIDSECFFPLGYTYH
ncbi:hypothetical protein BDZ91DRAFT_405782 [Kalaharituber pfeilii]|nr:hypothetical protein BDZ91DRAFT_405782 [Kalaharituber pfeilii]